MDGRLLLEKCCKDVGIDIGKFFYQEQNVESKERFYCSLDRSTHNEQQEFAIKYYAVEDWYVVWHLSPKDKRTKLSLQKNEKLKDDEWAINFNTKNKGNRGKNQETETVYLFRSRLLKEFLERILQGEI